MNSNIPTSLPANYDPLKDPIYMSADMVAFFKQKLTKRLEDLIQEEKLLKLNRVDFPSREAEYVETGQIEELRREEILSFQNEDNLKQEVEDALYRIDMATYGYCEETGDPIGVKRLLALPMARYTTEVQRRKDGLFF
jgi:DnaK suppressor protein